VFLRDIERLARSLAAQKLDPEYIRHYLMETYQIDKQTIDKVFERVGLSVSGTTKGVKPAPGLEQRSNDRRNRQGF
jgi:hypothetical protein